ncbi:hypothetical protein GCM10022419_116380 [Nonomuraea rosea]|uniref:Spore-associated protein A n=1 Tax=Nonomuraea rosea TaxID=638574 RepID=A0ABP6ZL00_9ACTN
MISRDVARFASAALLTTTLVASPVSASAAQSAYTPEQICGSGFGTVAGGTSPVTDVKGVVRGSVHLLYNARTGENCVVTIKSSFVGQPTLTRAVLLRQGTLEGSQDQGVYKYYAGPVKEQARGRCVQYRGYITNMRAGERSTGSTIHAYGGSLEYGNCGGGTKRLRGLS